MKTVLLIGSLLFLLLPFTYTTTKLEVGGEEISASSAYGFFYFAFSTSSSFDSSQDSSFFDDENNDGFEPDWIADDGAYASFFGKDYWMLGAIAMIFGILALVAAVLNINKGGILLIIGGLLTTFARYQLLNDADTFFYDSSDDLGITTTYIEIPIALIIGLIFGILSLKSGSNE